MTDSQQYDILSPDPDGFQPVGSDRTASLAVKPLVDAIVGLDPWVVHGDAELHCLFCFNTWRARENEPAWGHDPHCLWRRAKEWLQRQARAEWGDVLCDCAHPRWYHTTRSNPCFKGCRTCACTVAEEDFPTLVDV